MTEASEDPAAQDWLSRVGSLRQWSKGGERAPNKPLLLLYALGRLHNDGSSRVVYKSDEARLQQMLEEFGPPRQRSPHRPQFAFSRMPGDGIWKVDTSDGAALRADSRADLRRANAVGRLPSNDEQLLHAHPELLAQTVQRLLQGNWPESLHSEICEFVGLDLKELLEPEAGPASDAAPGSSRQGQKRDPYFRTQVLSAYEYQCAMCGWDARLSHASVGLEAAHIQWRAYDGPDHPKNGISLCVLHHRLFDRGVLGISPDLKVEVSQDFNGRGTSARLVIELANQDIIPPQSPAQRPEGRYINWHQEQVFKSPARLPR